MNMPLKVTLPRAGLAAGLLILGVTAGCSTRDTSSRSGYPNRGSQVQASLESYDDYDYYPNYEIYYGRRRGEYIYREGSTWVRRPQPSGIQLAVLLTAPSVRVDFHDEPERHHDRVVKAYPRNWKRDHRHHDRRDDDRDDDRRYDRRRN